MIPKIFHNIWLGNTMPDNHKYLVDRMLKMHPDWEYKLWTEANMPKLYNEKAYERMNRQCFKADVLRYEIVLKHGGVYIDTDFLFLKNIDELLNEEAIISREFPITRVPNINNCIIGMEPQHELMKFVVMKLEESFELKYEKLLIERGEHFAGIETVGPRFFDSCVRSFSPDLEKKAFPMKYFSPFRSSLPKDFYKPYPESYALHLWNHRFFLNDIDIPRLLEAQNIDTQNPTSNLA